MVGLDGQTDTVKDNQRQEDAMVGRDSQGDVTGWVGQTDGRSRWQTEVSNERDGQMEVKEMQQVG